MLEEEIKDYDFNCMMDNNFYVTNHKPVCTLKECLEVAEDRIIDMMYLRYITLINEKGLEEKVTRKEKMEKLEQFIKELFETTLRVMSKEERAFFENNGIDEKGRIHLLENGLLFGFQQNNKPTYIVPKELLNRYQEYQNSKEKKEYDTHKVLLYTATYLSMHSIIKKDDLIKTFQEEYNISFPKKEIEQIISKKFKTYQGYYVNFDGKETPDIFERCLEVKGNGEVVFLSEQELNAYINTIQDTLEKLEHVLKKENKDLACDIFERVVCTAIHPYKIVEEFKLTKKEKEKVVEILEARKNDFRYWYYNGKTEKEVEYEYLIEAMPLLKTPKNTDLETCLNNLSEDGLEEIYAFHCVDDIEELIDQIKIYARETIEELNNYEKENLWYQNGSEFIEDIPPEYVKSGIVFLQREKGKIKCIVPDEIINLLTANDFDLETLVMGYLDMNGILEKEKLKELLYKYHNMDSTYKEIEAIVKDFHGVIVANKYYTIIHDFEQKEIEHVMALKNQFAEYKEIDIDMMNIEQDFIDELYEFVEKTVPQSKIDEVFSSIRFLVKTAMFSEELLEQILNDCAVSLGTKKKKELLELYKKYKKYIGVWHLNGYTITEANEMKSKKVKVGRNELCLCGSGKKYKQCCGK